MAYSASGATHEAVEPQWETMHQLPALDVTRLRRHLADAAAEATAAAATVAAEAAATEAQLDEQARELQERLTELSHERDDLQRLCQSAVINATCFATSAFSNAFAPFASEASERTSDARESGETTPLDASSQRPTRAPSAAVERLSAQLDQAYTAARQAWAPVHNSLGLRFRLSTDAASGCQPADCRGHTLFFIRQE